MSLSRQSPRFGPVRFPPQGSGPTDGPHFHAMSRVGLVGSAAPFAEPQRRSLAVTQRQPDAPRRVVSFTGGPDGAAEADVFGFTVSTCRHSPEQPPSPPHIFTAALGREHGLAIRLLSIRKPLCLSTRVARTSLDPNELFSKGPKMNSQC